MAGKPYTPQRDKIVPLYQSGKAIYEVAAILGINPKTAARELRRQGIPTRPRTDETLVESAITLYQQGISCLEACKRVGISRPVLTLALEKRGIPIRGGSESMYLRFEGSTLEERKALSAAANAAWRGSKMTLESRIKNAQGKERNLSGISPAESQLALWLSERGIATIPQKAIGPYNADLATGTVAVEVFGGNWHASGHHARRFPARADYLFDQGWNLVIVWNQARDPLSIEAADYIASFIEECGADPSIRGEYRVIRGCGKELTRGKDHFDQLALKPSQRRTPSERPTYNGS